MQPPLRPARLAAFQQGGSPVHSAGYSSHKRTLVLARAACATAEQCVGIRFSRHLLCIHGSADGGLRPLAGGVWSVGCSQFEGGVQPGVCCMSSVRPGCQLLCLLTVCVCVLCLGLCCWGSQIGFVACFTSKLSDTVSSEIGKVRAAACCLLVLLGLPAIPPTHTGCLHPVPMRVQCQGVATHTCCQHVWSTHSLCTLSSRVCVCACSWLAC